MMLQPNSFLNALLQRAWTTMQKLFPVRSSSDKPNPKVSIVILTHNAFKYVRILFRTLSTTQDVSYEVIVVDNASSFPLRVYLICQYLLGKVNRVCLLDTNTLFAEGNNIGVSIGSRQTELVLLLNSDIEIRDPSWLKKLVDIHVQGVTAYGFVESGPWPRADGYCFLIDRNLFQQYRLDEYFQWWWSITRLQGQVLSAGYVVQAVNNHDDLVYHYGGKSGQGFKQATGMTIDEDTVRSWFGGKHVKVIDALS